MKVSVERSVCTLYYMVVLCVLCGMFMCEYCIFCVSIHVCACSNKKNNNNKFKCILLFVCVTGLGNGVSVGNFEESTIGLGEPCCCTIGLGEPCC